MVSFPFSVWLNATFSFPGVIPEIATDFVEFDFSANKEVDTLDKVPADFRDLYIPKDDKTGFKLDSENKQVKSAVSAILGYNTALRAARNDLKNVKTVDLAPLVDFGTDPASIKAAFDQRLADLRDANKGINPEKIRTDLAKEFKTQLDERDARLVEQDKEFYEEFVVDRAKKAIKDSGGDEELLLPLILKKVNAKRIDGKYRVQVKDESGDVRYSGSTGLLFSIKELVDEHKIDKRYGKLFTSDTKGGSGIKPGAAEGAAAARQFQDAQGNKSSRSKIASGLRKGQYSKA